MLQEVQGHKHDATFHLEKLVLRTVRIALRQRNLRRHLLQLLERLDAVIRNTLEHLRENEVVISIYLIIYEDKKNGIVYIQINSIDYK